METELCADAPLLPSIDVSLVVLDCASDGCDEPDIALGEVSELAEASTLLAPSDPADSDDPTGLVELPPDSWDDFEVPLTEGVELGESSTLLTPLSDAAELVPDSLPLVLLPEDLSLAEEVVLPLGWLGLLTSLADGDDSALMSDGPDSELSSLE